MIYLITYVVSALISLFSIFISNGSISSKDKDVAIIPVLNTIIAIYAIPLLVIASFRLLKRVMSKMHKKDSK